MARQAKTCQQAGWPEFSSQLSQRTDSQMLPSDLHVFGANCFGTQNFCLFWLFERDTVRTKHIWMLNEVVLSSKIACCRNLPNECNKHGEEGILVSLSIRWGFCKLMSILESLGFHNREVTAELYSVGDITQCTYEGICFMQEWELRKH